MALASSAEMGSRMGPTSGMDRPGLTTLSRLAQVMKVPLNRMSSITVWSYSLMSHLSDSSTADL